MANILIFGGNGFIGYEMVKSLLEKPSSSFNIYIVNRGKSWEWNKKSILSYKPVHLIKWDRDNPLSDCQELNSLLDKISHFAAVVDFSGYERKHVKDAVKYVRLKAKLYVYISSDSVYEVCAKDHIEPSRETDDTRPESKEEVKKLKRQDSYGHEKLSGEECLRKYSADMQYVCLRLADVVGPRDSTDRWWQYQLWIKLSQTLSIPVYIPKELEKTKISLVYAKDVASIICNILNLQGSCLNSVTQKAYNLSFNETCTIEELLILMYEAINHVNSKEHTSSKKSITIEHSSKRHVPHIYPSVDKGPINIEKALAHLMWKPHPLQNAVYETVQFYEMVHKDRQFNSEKKDISETLSEDLKGLYDSGTYAKIQSELFQILHLPSE